MKIVFYNIAYCTGLNGSWLQYLGKMWRFFWLPFRARNRIIETLEKEKADVICLAEVDEGSFRNRFRSQSRHLAQKLLFPFFYTQNIYRQWSMWKLMTLVRKQHDAILSHHPGQLKRHEFSVGGQKLVLEYVVGNISIFSVHLSVVSKKVRRQQLKELAEITRNCPRPHLVCGDFNIFKGLEELRDFIRSTGLKRIIKKPTFPSISPKQYLDIFLASPGIKVLRSGVVESYCSDHLPVWVEIAPHS
jgi:endonuclease/exonuclease/phosphatase family metal-dependent hydrolase